MSPGTVTHAGGHKNNEMSRPWIIGPTVRLKHFAAFLAAEQGAV